MRTSSHSPTSSFLQRSKFLIYPINSPPPPNLCKIMIISLQHQQFWWDNNWRETSQDIIWFSAMQRIYLQKAVSVIRTITELRNINIKPGGWTLVTMKSMSSFLKFPTHTTIDLIEHSYLKLPSPCSEKRRNISWMCSSGRLCSSRGAGGVGPDNIQSPFQPQPFSCPVVWRFLPGTTLNLGK